ncbi:uncharacterized protein LOC113147221 [Cyclospora cayetanensis]|uniref:Uncharacterized protein LOC113147221 n=1 Tax=Cyclospora cayetanensis TaxID=88456 RepID=A0A6P6RY65_9EIME|nr:uncharacterized protein LOC113147221 [Cyclospora cayetanensis]
MGSQTSTTRQHALNDTYRSGIPGIGPLQTGNVRQDDLRLSYSHGSNDGGIGDSFLSSPRGDLHVYGRGAGEARQLNEDNDLIPCVFTWTHGGHVVYLTGSFNNWSVENKFRLNRSGHEFSYIQNLRRGVHYYKFIVDDQWRYAPDQQTQTDEHGNINNVLDISGFRHLQFKTVSEAEQARNAPYHQCVPEPSEYASDAPPIPTLLTKCAVATVEPPPRSCFPVHCLSNHLFHDSHAPHIFGPQISCVASTQRWRIDNNKPTTGQRYATYIYLTVNPLYPFPTSGENGETEEDVNMSPGSTTSLNPLRDFLVLPEATTPRSRADTQATECPAPSVGSQCFDGSPKRPEESLSPATPEETEPGATTEVPQKVSDKEVSPGTSPACPNDLHIRSPPAAVATTNAAAEDSHNAVYFGIPCRSGTAGGALAEMHVFAQALYYCPYVTERDFFPSTHRDITGATGYPICKPSSFQRRWEAASVVSGCIRTAVHTIFAPPFGTPTEASVWCVQRPVRF